MRHAALLCAALLLGSSAAVERSDGSTTPASRSWESLALASQCAGIVEDVRSRAAAGDPTDLRMLAVLYDRGCGVPQNMPTALQYFRQAVRKNPADLLSSGYAALYGGNDTSESAGVASLTKAAAAGNPFAPNILGYYFSHRFVEQSDAKNAKYWYKVGSDRGDMMARARTADCMAFASSDSAGRDSAKALLQQAVDANEPLAFVFLGSYYMLGTNGYPKNWNRGHAYFEKAIALGSTQAKVTFFHSLDESDVTEHRIGEDEVDALYPDAASRLLPRAFLDASLGRALLGLSGTRPACAKALPLIEEGLKLTIPDADLNLAYCYEGGHGIPADEAKSMEYEKLAAAKGSQTAITYLNSLSASSSGYDAAQEARNYEGYHWAENHPMSGPPH